MKRTYTFLFIGLLLLSIGFTGFMFVEQLRGEKVLPHLANENDNHNANANDLKSIPEEAIRLRVIANSDSSADQWIKRKVRDEIVAEMKRWAMKPKHIDEARQLIQSKLSSFQQIAQNTLRTYGIQDSVDVTFAKVPFPTKLYGDQVYPAGEYEALRVTIGEGKGENWWCVLFPPLCFIDMSSGEAIPKEVSDPTATLSASIASDHQVYEPKVEKNTSHKKKNPEVKFYLLERLSSLWND
ncbi:stage II sporulation protein R [Thermoactinomyces sp. DSM 45892]|uniref:stage II sporulation protein R n=1 Tax=Thermoactinomyces sp. DSM 45892 TaxID=1882753 RepID=UPI00089D87B3|nr:stage II sporulation protein R [Thermoactinomyces sp. DSM 45892]SDY41072.1 stage II sporulation protein R [Thermoactinomyces sp. DSM 45892]